MDVLVGIAMAIVFICIALVVVGCVVMFVVSLYPHFLDFSKKSDGSEDADDSAHRAGHEPAVTSRHAR